jgi:hypothetical protein
VEPPIHRVCEQVEDYAARPYSFNHRKYRVLAFAVRSNIAGDKFPLDDAPVAEQKLDLTDRVGSFSGHESDHSLVITIVLLSEKRVNRQSLMRSPQQPLRDR